VQPKEKKKISIRAGRVALRCRVPAYQVWGLKFNHQDPQNERN
jgi:hypothetical protein